MRLRFFSRCKQSTASQSIILREGTAGCAVASATGFWDAESIIFNRGRSVASWTIHGTSCELIWLACIDTLLDDVPRKTV